MIKRTVLLVTVAAVMSVPAAALADDVTPPAQPNQGNRAARILERIARVEARMSKVQAKIQQHCSTTQPAPSGDQSAPQSGPSLADHCARAQERLQKAQDRLAQVKAKVQAWLQNHGLASTGPRASRRSRCATRGSSTSCQRVAEPASKPAP